jgi:hypothetical protein
MHNQRMIPVTIDGELGPLYDRTFDTQQPLKYACTTHAVSPTCGTDLDKPEP